MPSSHAQFMFFFATYSILFLLNRVKLEWALTKGIVVVSLFLAAVAVSVSR
jgi:dolichyldiphosphatase